MQRQKNQNRENYDVPKNGTLYVIKHSDDFINLDYNKVATDKLTVLIDPAIPDEIIHLRLREANFFGLLEYDHSRMSHKVLKISEKITNFNGSEIDLNGQEDSSDQFNHNEKSKSIIEDFLK